MWSTLFLPAPPDAERITKRGHEAEKDLGFPRRVTRLDWR
jgi:hypothetical protein